MAAILKFGTKTLTIESLIWGLQRFDSEREGTTSAIVAGHRLIQAGFPPNEALQFCELVCRWGGGLRVFANLPRHNGRGLSKLLASALCSAYSATNPQAAIEPLAAIKGLGISFASKHLRLLMPERYGVLDSRFHDAFGYALNGPGYSLFMDQLLRFADAARKASPKHFNEVPIATIEHSLFFLVQPRSVAEYERQHPGLRAILDDAM